jgi:nitrogenase subunit NifH|tara:strand:+ start:11046 stop:11666 length:621 start_codon:yes stop_codon:yes gene_type:complete
MAAADKVIVVLDPGIFALEGLSTLQHSFGDFFKRLGLNLNIDIFLITKCQDSVLPWRKKYAEEVKEDIEGNFKKKVFKIPYSEHIYETHAKGVPISHYKPKSSIGKVYKEVADKYLDLTKNKTRTSLIINKNNNSKYLDLGKKKDVNLIKKTQEDRFKKNIISKLVYNIRISKYKEKFQKIKQELPVLEKILEKIKKNVKEIASKK